MTATASESIMMRSSMLLQHLMATWQHCHSSPAAAVLELALHRGEEYLAWVEGQVCQIVAAAICKGPGANASQAAHGPRLSNGQGSSSQQQAAMSVEHSQAGTASAGP